MFSLHGASAPDRRIPLTLVPDVGPTFPRLVEAPRTPADEDWTPRELRSDAQAVLARLGRLCPSDRPWSGPSVDELDEITRDLELLQRRIAACSWGHDPAALCDVIRARRCVDHALVLTLTALNGLRAA